MMELHAEDYVNLTGRKDADGVEDEMLRASLYAMSSSSEGFPFVLLEAQSCGLFELDFDVVGPVTVSKDYSHYGVNDSIGNDLHAGEMVIEALY